MAEVDQVGLAPSEQSVVARYEALIRVSQAVSAHREPRKLFDILVGELRRVIEFDGIGIAQYDDCTGAVQWHISIDCAGPNPALQDKCLTTEAMTCWVFQHQRPLVIPFVDREIRFPDTMVFLRTHGVQSVCMLPLTTVHRRLGSMFIASERPNAYSEDEVRFLGMVADQMALAIDDALNFEASRTAQEQLKLLLDLTNSAVSALDLRELLRSVSGNLRRVMSCDLVGVGLPDPGDKKHLRLFALDFPDSKGFLREEILIPLEGTPPGNVFATGELTYKTIAEEIDSREVNSTEAEVRHGFQIAEVLNRAYEIRRARGGFFGYNLQDWLQAEREIASGDHANSRGEETTGAGSLCENDANNCEKCFGLNL